MEFQELTRHFQELRERLLVFLDGALGTRRGELGALRWSDCNFDSMSFSVQHSYYWRRGGHLKATKTEASAKVLPMHLTLKDALLEWKSQNEYNKPGDFVFPSRRHKGRNPLDLGAFLKKKIQPAFAKMGINGVGWHTFRHTVGAMLAEMGEYQLTIRDFLRYSNLHVTNKYLQATPESKRLAQGKLVDAILPTAFCEQINTIIQELVLESASQDPFEGVRGGRSAWNAYWTQTDPDLFLGLV